MEDEHIVLPECAESEAGAERKALWHRRLAIEEVVERQYRRHRVLRERRGNRIEPRPMADVLLKAVGLFERGRRNALRPVLRRIDLSFENLPEAFDGFRILQISDPHFDDRLELVEALKALLDGVESDLCVFTGDYRYEDWGPWQDAIAGMERLLPLVRAHHGIYAILGNHDPSQLIEPYRVMGIRWLINENAAVSRGGQSVYLAGIDDNHRYRCHSLPLALEGIPEGAFRILLAHSPAIVWEAVEAKVDLCLCGHTHAGQIRLPLLGAPFLNAPGTPRNVCAGTWRRGRTQGYTSAGTGSTSTPVRYNCPPEVALLRLCAQR